MALVAHNGSISVGTILGSEYNGITSGFKVLSKVYIETIQDYMYVVQYGDVKRSEGKFSPYGEGKDLGLLSYSSLKDSYSKKWVKDEVKAVKDGDVLRSEDRKHIFIVRGTHKGEPKLYRVSGGDNLFDRLTNYEATYGKLTVMKVDYDENRRFSAPVTDEDKTGNGW